MLRALFFALQQIGTSFDNHPDYLPHPTNSQGRSLKAFGNVKKVEDLRETIFAVSSLLECPFLSPSTVANLEILKSNLETELHFMLARQNESAAAD